MRVLLIEDDSAVAQSIELMLKSESFNVYTTDLGEEGVDLGKLYDYDIILLDLNLPDMSGYDVLKQLRVSKIKTPILILSGLAGKDSGQVNEKIHEIDRIIDGAPLDRKKLDSGGDQVTAEQLFQNRKVTDMLTDAQMKQKDYTTQPRNVFFGPDKNYFGQKLNIFFFNSCVINGFTLIFLLGLLWSLHRQLRTM